MYRFRQIAVILGLDEMDQEIDQRVNLIPRKDIDLILLRPVFPLFIA
jgi:hypothetical protein